MCELQAYFCELLRFFVFFFFLPLNLSLTFYSVNATFGRSNKSFRFSFERKIPRMEQILKVRLGHM